MQNVKREIPDTIMMKDAPDRQEWRVPIQLNCSAQPLYLKVTLSGGFPQIAPTV